MPLLRESAGLPVPHQSPIPTGGRFEDLYEVIGRFRAGQIKSDIERFAMTDAFEDYVGSKPANCHVVRS